MKFKELKEAWTNWELSDYELIEKLLEQYEHDFREVIKEKLIDLAKNEDLKDVVYGGSLIFSVSINELLKDLECRLREGR